MQSTKNNLSRRTESKVNLAVCPIQTRFGGFVSLYRGGRKNDMEKKSRSNRSFNPAGVGHCALGADDLGGQSDDIRGLVTMTREEARREVLKIHHRGIFSILDKCLKGGR